MIKKHVVPTSHSGISVGKRKIVFASAVLVVVLIEGILQVFCDIVVRDGEMVCVELVARGRGGAAQAVIFLGSIRYDALTRVYESRVSHHQPLALLYVFHWL
jgi:hypothetical protein